MIVLVVGCLIVGVVFMWMNWYFFLNICLVGMVMVMLLSLLFVENVVDSIIVSWVDVLIVVFFILLIGLMMVFIYFVLNLVMLSVLF